MRDSAAAAPPPRTLLDRLEWWARTEPARVAYVFDSRPWTYGELWIGIERFAATLVGLALQPRERVVIALPNGPDFFHGFYGAIRAGAIAVPVFPDSGAGRLIKVAERSGARLVVTASAALGEDVSRQAPALEVIAPDAEDRPTTPRTGAGEPPPLPTPEARQVAYIQYTSGSTGEPKGVQITHANCLANIEQLMAGMAITAADVFVSWLPVHHDMGLVLMSMTPFFCGARLILLPASLHRVLSWLAEIESHRGTFTAAPDFAYRLALRHLRDGRYDLSSLRVALDAAEPVRPGTVSEFERVLGLDGVVIPGYGLAEATAGACIWSPAVAVKVDARGLPAMGPGLPGIETRILGEEGLVGPGEEGEILIRSASNTPGYWDDPEATAALHWRDGFMRTGDLGYLDEAGDLFVVGRRKNIIIQAGRNIAPGEVEELMDSFPFVRRSAAVGVDRGGIEGEQIYAFVELRERKPRTPEQYRRLAIEVTAHVRSELGLGPGRLYLVRPGTLPFTHNGKVRHVELKRRYLDGELAAEGRLLYPDY